MAAILAVSVGCCRRPLLGDVPASICVQSVIIILGFRLETAQPFSIRLYDCSAFPFTVFRNHHCFGDLLLFFKYIFCTLRKFRSPYLGKNTAAAGAALPNPISLVRPNDGMAVRVQN